MYFQKIMLTSRITLILILISNFSLQRIHNTLIGQYFTKFESDHFVPNNVLGYVYPMDRFSSHPAFKDNFADGDILTKKGYDSSNGVEHTISIIRGIDKISQKLKSAIENEDVTKDSEFLHSLLAGLSTHSNTEEDQTTSMYAMVSALYHFHVKINSLLWSRRLHLEHKPKIKFSLGQVVKHKLYDYRGVIVAWDHKPRVDVSNWDGLQNVENPQNQPFYHIIPDEKDCFRAFGGPRSFRYVCQANVELCEPAQLTVDDLNAQQWKWDAVQRSYIPSDEIKVRLLCLQNLTPLLFLTCFAPVLVRRRT
jgi:hemimethylated DNA binding protein